MDHRSPFKMSRIGLVAAIACLMMGLPWIVAAVDQGRAPEGDSLLPTARLGPPPAEVRAFAEPPRFRTGPLEPEVAAAVPVVFGESLRRNEWGGAQLRALTILATSGDVRIAWMLSDLMRIVSDPGLSSVLELAASELMEIEFKTDRHWREMADHLIAWDVPAPPNYLSVKREIYTLIVPEWERILVPGEIDWRHVSWGGVRIDDRAYGKTEEPCNCIPASDNPEVTSAAEATWLPEDEIVFGIGIGDEYRAYPRRIMEVREMVNDTLGGRHLGIPYCTLCGSAQAYFTDDVPAGVERPILRTSGLLIRSNKVMYDLNTYSVMDTFRGNAVTGPLAEKGVTLKQASVVTTRWRDWKAAHPETTVLAEKHALGRNPDFRNNRDANGPIFPIGNVDGRLPVQEDILGVLTESGRPIAFQASAARAALLRGEEVGLADIRLKLDGGGLVAVDRAGKKMGGHEAFWFAWSQFYPQTQLWVEPL